MEVSSFPWNYDYIKYFDVLTQETGCGQNISHTLNCYLCDAREFKQVVMIAPST